ncbi:MAG: cation:proton antiporter [Myxococcota bacterium]
MHHGSELVAVATLCAILLSGLAARPISRWLGLPHTVLVLLVGLAVGLWLPEQSVVTTGDEVRPDLILFVFLPVLVFESAFSMQVHAVRRDLGAVLWLAGPVVVATTLGVAAWMVAVTAPTWAWSWPAALVFGALVSATDPVAVVALLREIGAPKRISVLIEGESLFNDGTAIVVFTLVLSVLVGQGPFDPLGTAGRFLAVAGGGVAVGASLAIAASAWMRRTFNQPVVEITLTVTLAYLSMVVAETLHVSGVMAVVVAGLWMSGPGRVTISPEVLSFLHRFWQVLASIANTLIFFLVGLAAAVPLGRAGLVDLAVIAASLVGIVGVRVALVFASRPVLGALAEPVSPGETAVIAWSGLRGAVSLALALMVSQEPGVPEALREQVVLVTAGVVLGTLLVSGTTIGPLLRRLGFDRAPASDRRAQADTRASILAHVAAELAEVRARPDLRTVRWTTVDEELAARRAEVAQDQREAEAELARLPGPRDAGTWAQALSIERAAYWDAFAHGTLGAAAVQLLDDSVDARMQALQHDPLEPGDWAVGELSGWRAVVDRWLHRPGVTLVSAQFTMLELRYEIARGQGLAATAVLEALDHGELEDPEVRRVYQAWRHRTIERLEAFRTTLPEMTEALETRIARRISLDLERDAVRTLARRGALDPDAATRARTAIEARMKRLHGLPMKVSLPPTSEICRAVPRFAGLDAAALDRLGALTTERAVTPGEVLYAQGSPAVDVFIVARGAVAAMRDDGEPRLVDLLGSGAILGDVELLTGQPAHHTMRALTDGLVGQIPHDRFAALLDELPEVEEQLHGSLGRQRFVHHLHGAPGSSWPELLGMSDTERLAWLERGTRHTLRDREPAPEGPLLFVASGALAGAAHTAAPALLRPLPGDPLVAVGTTRVVVLEEPPGTGG